jgi:AAA domain
MSTRKQYSAYGYDEDGRARQWDDCFSSDPAFDENGRPFGDRVNGSKPKPLPSLNIAEFLAEPEPEKTEVIPGILQRGERLIVTGGEGGGKTYLLAQLGTQGAAGIHPFTLAPAEPARVLLIDCENPREHWKKSILRPLFVAAGKDLDADRLRVESQPAGIDLLQYEWRTWLEERIVANTPDLLVFGPLYKLAMGDPTSEETARRVAFAIDYLRGVYDVAVIIEAHSPYAPSGGKRPARPYGASLWSRWPEFGIHLGDDGALTHWRGPRAERDWPAALKRGGDWPWTVETDRGRATFAKIADVTRERGQQLSIRDLATACGCSKSQLDRIIAANRSAYDELLQEVTA